MGFLQLIRSIGCRSESGLPVPILLMPQIMCSGILTDWSELALETLDPQRIGE